jgi:hypothetical protein
VKWRGRKKMRFLDFRVLTLVSYTAVTVCNLCAKRSVQVQMADQPYQQIACPECPELLTLDIIRIYSTPEDFDR